MTLPFQASFEGPWTRLAFLLQMLIFFAWLFRENNQSKYFDYSFCSLPLSMMVYNVFIYYSL